MFKHLIRTLKSRRGEVTIKPAVVPGELPTEESPPVHNFSSDNLPKSKDEWNSLRQADPIVFADLTQQNFDRVYRENKELQEKNIEAENQRNNLTVELDKYRNPIVPETEQTYSVNNLPGTKKEWEDLMIEDPVLGNDLRIHYNTTLNRNQQIYQETFTASQKIVQGEHPDMYVAELDSTGQPKKDENGKLVLQRNQNGELIFDSNSEKGKLWDQLFIENEQALSSAPNGPELLMSLMERRLRSKGQGIVNSVNNEREQRINDGQIVPEGIPPPAKVNISFKNDSERDWATNAVNRGTYKNLEDYVQHRDAKDEGYYDDNRMPTFNGKAI